MRRRFTASWLLSAFSLFSVVAFGADSLYESAQLKLDSIAEGTAKPSSQILFTPREIEAWVEVKAREQVGEGVRDPRVQFETGSGVASVLVDLLKIRDSRGK